MEATNTTKPNYKISNEEFLETLKENYCLYAETARAIIRKYNRPYTKQAVQRRAQRFYKEIKRFKEEMRELAHKNIFEAMKQDKSLTLKYRASLYVINKIDRNENAKSKKPKKKKRP